MAIAPGTHIGPYEVLASLGAGGMGEVWKARDTRLERTVAIKVLPSHLSNDTELRARLEREARVVSGLKHPNICVLHDVGHQDGVDYLVMEYLEGQTLAKALEGGPLPVPRALAIGSEIAGALERAHRAGVTHRDLKPGNVILTRDGAKLLDFGLAKSSVATRSADFSAFVTEGQPLTGKGTVLGTVLYMAPEQLEGREVDARTDLFALGLVLYEMVTGRRAFSGSSQASLIAAILKEEPESLSTLQPTSPPGLERLVKACLAKDPDERWQSAGDVRRELVWIAGGGSHVGLPAPVAARRRSREALAWSAFAVAFFLAVAFAVRSAQPAPKPAPLLRAALPLPHQVAFLGQLALSPDGTKLAYTFSRAGDEIGRLSLGIWSLDAPAGLPVTGGEDALFPFWSPDGGSVAFFTSDGKLKRVDASGGSLLTICDAENGRGGTWNRDGTIVFAPGPSSPLFRVAAGGGQPVAVTKLDVSRKETTHRYPSFLPDGRRFLYTAANYAGSPDDPANAVRVGSLDAGDDRILVAGASNAVLASDHLLYARSGTLIAQRLDRGLGTVGDPVPIAQRLESGYIAYWFAFTVSPTGLLVYAPADFPPTKLAWFDRRGTELGTVGAPATFFAPRLSPDGRRIAVSVFDPVRSGWDVWLYGADGGGATKLVFGPYDHAQPVWSPDGTRIAFFDNRRTRAAKGDIRVRTVDGSKEEVLLENDDVNTPEDWSRDGRYLSVMTDPVQGKVTRQIWGLDLSTGKRVMTAANAGGGGRDSSRFSPDGRWLAYGSSESGRWEVYVEAFPGPGEKRQVSPAGGGNPCWRADGRELFYEALDGKLVSVPIEPGPTVRAGRPVPLFTIHGAVGLGTHYDVSADGQRFLVANLESGRRTPPLQVLVNWPSLLKP